MVLGINFFVWQVTMTNLSQGNISTSFFDKVD